MTYTNIKVLQDFGSYSEISVSGLSGILVDNDDISKLSKYRWYLDRTKAKKDSLYYFRTNYEYIGNKKYKAISLHRFIMNQFTYDGNHVIDHINQNSKDNRKENLRYVTAQVNMNNCRKNIIRPEFIDYKVEPVEHFLPMFSITYKNDMSIAKVIHDGVTYIIQVPKFKGKFKKNKLGYKGISYNKAEFKWEVYGYKKRYGLFSDLELAMKKAYEIYNIPYEISKF